MKNLIISNGPMSFRMKQVLGDRFLEKREVVDTMPCRPISNNWFLDKLLGLDSGDNLVMEIGYVSTEVMAQAVGYLHILIRQKKRLNIHLLCVDVQGILDRYLLCPKESAYDLAFIRVLNYHNIIQIGTNPSMDFMLKSMAEVADEMYA